MYVKYLAVLFIGICLLGSCNPQQTKSPSEEEGTRFVFPMGNDTLNIVDIQIKSEHVATIRCTSKLDQEVLLKFVFEETKRRYGVYSFWVDGESENYAEYRLLNDSTACLYMYNTRHTYLLSIDNEDNYNIREKRKY